MGPAVHARVPSRQRGRPDTQAEIVGWWTRPTSRSPVGGEFVVSASQVLHERVPAAMVPKERISLARGSIAAVL